MKGCSFHNGRLCPPPKHGMDVQANETLGWHISPYDTKTSGGNFN